LIELLKVRWIHLQIAWGSKYWNDDEEGNKLIPCKQCGEQFMSYLHYDHEGLGYTYDDKCNRCQART